MWDAIVPAVVQVLLLLIPALGTLVLAVVTRATLKLQAAKQAAVNVEFSPLARQGALSSEQKMQLAVDQIRSPATPLMARMSAAEAVRIVEAVLPDVSRLSDTSQLRPSSLKPSDAITVVTRPPPRKSPPL